MEEEAEEAMEVVGGDAVGRDGLATAKATDWWEEGTAAGGGDHGGAVVVGASVVESVEEDEADVSVDARALALSTPMEARNASTLSALISPVMM